MIGDARFLLYRSSNHQPLTDHKSLITDCRQCAATCGCGALVVAAAAGLADGCACCPAAALRCMSTVPRKCAPSAMATRGDTMSPSTDPPSRMSTFSVAVTLPLTSPRTITDLACTCALILPLGPIVST